MANEDPETLSSSFLSTAKLYHQYKQQDSAEYYAKKAIEAAESEKILQDILNAGRYCVPVLMRTTMSCRLINIKK